MGVPRTDPDTLKIAGVKPSRVARAGEKMRAEGLPAKPKGMSEAASKHWDLIVPKLVASGAVVALDESVIETMCRSWALMKRCERQLDKDPIDKDVRTAWNSYRDAWAKACRQLGIGPAARQAIRVHKKTEEKQGIQTRRRA